MKNFKQIIAKQISKIINIDEQELTSYIETPKDTKNGDYAFPCFRLAKELRKAPPVIANEIKEKIRRELDLLNFNFTHEGSKYLLECIYQVYTLEYIDDMNLSKIIYPILAKKYKKTVNTIYGNIKQAINSMFDNCPKKVLKNYFNFNCLIKPRPKEVIYTILNKINN